MSVSSSTPATVIEQVMGGNTRELLTLTSNP
jgi:hypothetical protein